MQLYRQDGRPQHRVVVTGMGVVTPIGNSLDTYWPALLEGRSGAGLITRFDVSAFTTQIACEVKDYDPSQVAERKEARRLDRAQLLALGASDQAIAHAGLDFDKVDRNRCGTPPPRKRQGGAPRGLRVVLGTALGAGIEYLSDL